MLKWRGLTAAVRCVVWKEALETRGTMAEVRKQVWGRKLARRLCV